MTQKIIKVGNSLAVIIPARYMKELGWKVGQKVRMLPDIYRKQIIIQSMNAPVPKEISAITPEFLKWVDEFTDRHKDIFKELRGKRSKT